MSARARPAEPPIGEAAPAVDGDPREVEFDCDGAGDAVVEGGRRVGERRDRPRCRRKRVEEQVSAMARRPRRDGGGRCARRSGRRRPVDGVCGPRRRSRSVERTPGPHAGETRDEVADEEGCRRETGSSEMITARRLTMAAFVHRTRRWAGPRGSSMSQAVVPVLRPPASVCIGSLVSGTAREGVAQAGAESGLLRPHKSLRSTS